MLASTTYDPEATFEHGCGQIKSNGFHGDSRGEFYVYTVDQFSRRWESTRVTRLDLKCETFAPAEQFCHNCTRVSEEFECDRYKCLGHSIGHVDGRTQAHIQYADDSRTLIKEDLESVFMILQHKLRDLSGADVPSGLFASTGFVAGQFHACLPQYDDFLELALQYYWACCKEPCVGIQALKTGAAMTLVRQTRVCLWSSDHGN